MATSSKKVPLRAAFDMLVKIEASLAGSDDFESEAKRLLPFLGKKSEIKSQKGTSRYYFDVPAFRKLRDLTVVITYDYVK